MTLKGENHEDSAISATTIFMIQILSDCTTRPILIEPISSASYDISFGYALDLGQLLAITSSTQCTSQIVYNLIDLALS